jgi:hypothetical protein
MQASLHGHSELGIPRSVAEKVLHDQIATELPSELTRTATSVASGQQGGKISEAERTLSQLAEQHGMSTGNIVKTILMARHDRAEATDRARRARDQGPETFRGMPTGYRGTPGAVLAGDARRSFFNTFPEAKGLADGLPAFTPKVLW